MLVENVFSRKIYRYFYHYVAIVLLTVTAAILNLLHLRSIMGCPRGSRSVLGTLTKDVFERRTSTGSEAFSLFICLDANKLVLLSFFSLLKTIYPRVSTKPLPNDAKSPLPVDVRSSKTLLLKLPIYARFSGKKRTSLYLSREKGDHYYIQTRHNDLFSPLQSFSDRAHAPWASHNTP